jgi:CheY-like chemotaxis protein
MSARTPADETDVRAEVRALMKNTVADADWLLGTELAPEQRVVVERVRRASEAAARLVGAGAAHSTATPETAGDTPSAADRPRVLLVEDNEVNQRVTRLLLQKRGYVVEVACDGHEAVVATARTPFAAVLMDCHMPRFDGYAATTEIRARSGPGARVPIIAMTANAGPGARERCLAAGMDDYVAKPVDTDALDAVLRRWVAAPPAAAELSVRRKPSIPPIDLAMLRRLRVGLPVGGSDVVGEVIGIFRREAPVRLLALRDALARGDLVAAGRTAHTLKGSAGHLGAKTLGALCARLEEQVRTGAPFDVAFAVQAIADELERVDAALLEAREEPSRPTSAQSSRASSRAPGSGT